MNSDKACRLCRLMNKGAADDITLAALQEAGYEWLCGDISALLENHRRLQQALAAGDASVVDLTDSYAVREVPGRTKKGSGRWEPIIRRDKLDRLLFHHVFLSGLCRTVYRGKLMNYSSMLMLYRKQPVKKAVKLLPAFEIAEGRSEGVAGETIFLTKQDADRCSTKDVKGRLLAMTEKIGVFFDFAQAAGSIHVMELPGMAFRDAAVFLYLMDLAYSFGMTYNEMCCLWGISVPDQEKTLAAAGQWVYSAGTDIYVAGDNTDWKLMRTTLYDQTVISKEGSVHEICSF